jgi:hypothetical protein
MAGSFAIQQSKTILARAPSDGSNRRNKQPCVGTVLSAAKKKPAWNRFQSRLSRLRHLSTDSSNDDGGGGNSGARRTNSKAGNSHRGSTHNSPDSQPQLRPKPERQNAAREQKPIHLPPVQLREVFSCNFPFLFVVLLGMEAPAKDFLDALKMRLSL